MGTTKTFDIVSKDTDGLRTRYYYIRSDGSEGPSININVEDVEECREAASLLYALIFDVDDLGLVANQIFSTRMLSKREIAAQKNYRLLIAVMHRVKSQSLDQIAADLAKENDGLPPELKYGPTGTTS